MLRLRSAWLGLGTLLPVAAVLTLEPTVSFEIASASAQFSPDGRKRVRPSERTTPPKADSARASDLSPARASSRESSAPAGSPRPRTFPEGMYEAVLESPGEAFVLSKLIEVVSDQDPELARLTHRLDRELGRADQSRPYGAMMALGRLALLRGDGDLARQWFEKAVRRSPARIHAYAALAELRSGSAALDFLETALGQVKGADREVLLERLRLMAVEAGAEERALRYHAELTRLAPERASELGELHLGRGEAQSAIGAFEGALRDAPAPKIAAHLWLGLARAHGAAGQFDRAARDLDQLRALGGGDPSVKEEAMLFGVEVAAAQGTLSEYAEKFEASPSPALLLKLSGALEASGSSASALRLDERALEIAPRDLEIRRAHAERLERAARLAEARSAYRELLAIAPSDLRAWLRILEISSVLGDSARPEDDFALALARVSSDEKLTIIDRCFTSLSASICERFEKKLIAESRDRSLLFELGSRRFIAGDRSAAREAWLKGRGANPDAETWSQYADLLMDHELTEEGLAAHERARARAPLDMKIRRARALALERSLSSDPKVRGADRRGLATAAWLEILFDPSAQGRQKEEAARHAARLWQRSGVLEVECERLRRNYELDPRDRANADLYVEALMLLGRREEATGVLESLVQAAPFDSRQRARLVRAVGPNGAQAARLGADALALTERSALEQKLREQAKRELDQRRTEQALGTLERLRALRPRDAGVLLLEADALGQLGRRALAAQKIEEALLLEPRRAAVLMKKAAFLLQEGRAREAAQIYIHVVRSGPAPEELAEASDALLLLRAKAGPEGSLILLAIEEGARTAFSSRPGHPGYRALLLALYDSMFLTREDERGSREAPEGLARAAERARMPLLSILRNGTDSERAQAARLLARVGGPDSARALFDYALSGASDGDVCHLLERLGSHGDDESVRAITDALAAGDAFTPQVRLSLGFALAKSASAKAIPQLLELLSEDMAELQTIGWLGLFGRISDRTALPRVGSLRAATEASRLLTLGPPQNPPRSLAQSPSLVRGATLVARVLHSGGELGAWQQDPAVREALASAITDPDPLLQAAAARALALASGAEFGAPLPDTLCGRSSDLDGWVRGLLTRKGRIDAERWQTLRIELESALRSRLGGGVVEQARALAFLTQAGAGEPETPAVFLESLRLALAPDVEALFVRGDPKIRGQVLDLLPFPSPSRLEVRRVLQEMLMAGSVDDSLKAFAFVLERGDPESARWLVQAWSENRSWAFRNAAAEALRRKSSLPPLLRELLTRSERESLESSSRSLQSTDR